MLKLGPCIALISEPNHQILSTQPEYFTLFTKTPDSRAIILSYSIPLVLDEGMSVKDLTVVRLEHGDETLHIASLYVPPRERGYFGQQLDRTEGQLLQRTFFAAGDLNARHRSWDGKTNPHGVALREFTDRHDFMLWTSPVPTFMRTRQLTDGQFRIEQSNIDVAFYTQTLPVKSTFNTHLANSDHGLIQHTITLNTFTTIALKPSSRLYRENEDLLGKLESEFATIDFSNLHTFPALLASLSPICAAVLGHTTPKARPISRQTLPEEIRMQRSIVRRAKKKCSSHTKNARSPDPVKLQELILAIRNAETQLRTMELKHEADSFAELMASGPSFGPPYKIVKGLLAPRSKQQFPRENVLGLLQELFPGLCPLLPIDDSERNLRVVEGRDATNPDWRWEKVDANWVRVNLGYIKPKKAPGIDGLTGGILNKLPETAFGAIARMINSCLVNSVFPNEFKVANLCLLPKANKTDYTKGTSFRPISLLSCLSKVLERAILEHLEALVSPHLSPHQHGFRSGKSTLTTLSAISDWIDADPWSLRALIAVDFTGAFDTASHRIIIEQLDRWGIPGPVVSMIRDYLANRRIMWEGVTYSAGRIGCPQGSVLAPILWNILLNSLLELLVKDGFFCAAYADDVTGGVKAKTIGDLRLNIEQCLRTITNWAKDNKLTISVGKTTILPIKCNLRVTHIHNFPVVEYTKILGLTYTTSHTFNTHVQEKLTKVRAFKNMWNRLVRSTTILNESSRLMIFKGAIRPMLMYGSEIWSRHISASSRTDLEKFYRAYLLSALGAYRDTSNLDLHNLARCLTVEQELALSRTWQPERDPTVIINRLSNPTHYKGPMPGSDSPVKILTHIRQGPEHLLGHMIVESAGPELELTYTFPIHSDWSRADECMISAAAQHILQHDSRNTWYIACTTNPFDNKRVTPQWADTLRTMKRHNIRLVLTGHWTNHPATIYSEELTVLHDQGSRPVTRRAEMRNLVAENLELSRKPEILRLMRSTKYPYREQVWIATGHGPWPSYLHRVHAGNYECLCGSPNTDWRHLCNCVSLGLPITETDWHLPAYSGAIARRGQRICKSFLYRKETSTAIPLGPAPVPVVRETEEQIDPDELETPDCTPE